MAVNIDTSNKTFFVGVLWKAMNGTGINRQIGTSNLSETVSFLSVCLAKNPISQSMSNDSDKLYRHLGVLLLSLLDLYLELVEM